MFKKLFFVVFLLSAAFSQAQWTYRLINPPPGYTLLSATDMNNLGQVLALVNNPSGMLHIFVFNPDGSYSDYGNPVSSLAGSSILRTASGINDNGVFVGTVDYPVNLQTHVAAAYGFMGGPQGYSYIVGTQSASGWTTGGINDAGQIAAYNDTDGWATIFNDLGAQGSIGDLFGIGTSGSATAISSNGIAAGKALDGSAYVAATFYQGAATYYPLPAGFSGSVAQSVNSAGVAVGYGSQSADYATNAFLYQNGQTTDMGQNPDDPAQFYVEGVSINDSGYIVGLDEYGSGDTVDTWIYRNGVMQSLETLAGIPYPTEPIKINNNDEVLIRYFYNAYESYGYLVAYQPLQQVSAQVSPQDAGTVRGTGVFGPQDQVTLTETPSPGATFEGWYLNGTLVSTSASYSPTAQVGAFAYVAQYKVPKPTLTCIPTAIPGGRFALVRLNLALAVPSSYTFNLTDSNTPDLAAPTTVTVPEGSSVISFDINTNPVSVDTPATMTTTVFGQTATCNVTIMAPRLNLLRTSSNTVAGGNNFPFTVVLTTVAPTNGYTVNLKSSDTGAGTVPATATITPDHFSVGEALTTKPVDANTVVTITASNAYSSATTTVTVKPATLKSVAVSTGSGVGGASYKPTGTVTLASAAGPSGVVVTLSSNNAALVVPASVKVLAGKTTATFACTSSVVTSDKTVKVTASANSSTETASVTVEP